MSQVYKLKIDAKHINPKITRTILVPEDITFYDLHRIMLKLFGFDGCHLYFFRINRELDCISEFEDCLDADEIMLKEYLMDYPKISYIYDMGDNWQFTITQQRVVPYNSKINYPHIVKSQGGFILEDCGGLWGYTTIATWCRDKTKTNEQELIDFFGDAEVLENYRDFDPDYFDKDNIKFHENF